MSDPGFDEKHGIYDLGTITFDAPQQPGAMPLVKCNYTGMDRKEHACSSFVLVSLPEPTYASALLAVHSTDASTQMPPIARSVVASEAIGIIDDWIDTVVDGQYRACESEYP